MAIAGLAVWLLLAGPWLWRWGWGRLEWQRAQDALSRYDFAEAASCLDRYVQHQPRDAAGWFLAGRTARRLGRVAEAERDLERCQQLGGVTDATRLEWDLLRVQQGDVAGIDAKLRRTVGPDHPDALLVLEALARGYAQAQRLNDAKEACELWLSREPGHPWPWLVRGWYFQRVGDLGRALADYQRAVNNAPHDRGARLALGRLLAYRWQPGPAAEQFEAVLTASPDDEEATLGLAGCRIDQGRPAEAVPAVERVLAANPRSAEALLLRGRAALELHDPGAAEGWLRRAVDAAPNEAEPLHLLVRALRALRKDEEADRLGRRLEQLRADLTRLGDLVGESVKHPDDAAPRREAAAVCLRLDRPAEALRWLEGALTCKGDPRPTHAALADYYSRTGSPERAEAHRRLAEQP